MQLSNLDIICRRSLLERSLPIHYYLEALIHASACLRELTIDTLQVVNTVQVSVDDTGSFDLPDDFADDVGMAGGIQGRLIGIPHSSNPNPIRYHNVTTGAFEAQPQVNFGLGGTGLYGVGGSWFWNCDDYGEGTGGYFGGNAGTSRGYSIFREQRRGQLSMGFGTGGSGILMYVSDGQNINNASQIDIKAINCISRWIDWKMSRNATNLFSPEAMTFSKSKKNLKARISTLTGADVANIIRTSYTASIKS